MKVWPSHTGSSGMEPSGIRPSDVVVTFVGSSSVSSPGSKVIVYPFWAYLGYATRLPVIRVSLVRGCSVPSGSRVTQPVKVWPSL